MADLQIKTLHKSFGDTPILHGVDLDIRDGEFLVFVGPSGCGKSTLLRCIAGLEEITAGELFIGGAKVNDVPPSKRGIAMVFQNYALYPHMTVAENMAFGLRLAGASKAEREAAVRKAAQILQIEPLLDRMPKALSGGQRQRVAIGRAIVRKPGVFLFDEPLSNLDAALRVQMRVELSQLHDELKTTMIYVTHDQTEAMTLADRIVVLNHGRIEQVGAPLDLYHRPANCFVAGFIGSPKMNFLPCELIAATATEASVRLTDGVEVAVAADARSLAPGSRLTLGIRPEHLQTGPVGAAHAIPARVKVAERLGDRTFLHVAVEGMSAALVVAAEAGNPLTTGDAAGLAFAPGRAFLFNGEGRTLPAFT
jgi:multiple sugar transport system ATP-binding protein